jgi:spore maturation protein CgeB
MAHACRAPIVKLTIFGLTLSSSWGNGHATPYRALLRALARQGLTSTFYEKDVEYYAWRRDFTSCDYCELVLYSDWESVRRRALADVRESDVVIVGSFCPEGARINNEILGVSGPLHVFYDLDTPVTLSQLRQSSAEYVRADQIPAFDLYLSFTGGSILRQLEEVWHARLARPLYGCVDPEVHRRTQSRCEFQCDLSYMGTYSSDRQHKFEQLFLEPARRTPEARFVLAGSLYPKRWNLPPNVSRFDHVAPAEHPVLYSSSRATLNLTRDNMARSGYCPSGRFFEAAACGTPIISDWWEGLDHFFTPGEEILVSHNAEQLINALSSDEHAMERLSTRARERTLDQYTGACRAHELLGYLEEAKLQPMPGDSLEVAS